MQNNKSSNSNYENTPIVDVAKSIMLKSFVASFLCIIVYMSVLFVYRTVAKPAPQGYYTKITTVNEDNVKEDKHEDTYYFENDEEHKLPKADKTHYYGAVYGWDAVPEVVSQILMVLIVALFIYDAAWNFGAARKNAVLFGRIQRDKAEGLKLGIISVIVGIFSYFVMLFSVIGLKIDFAYKFFAAVNSWFLPSLNYFFVTPHEISGIAAITTGDVRGIQPLGMLMMLIPILLKIAICYLGYEMGYHQISLKEKILYKSKAKNEI